MTIHLSELLSPEDLKEVDKWCAKYPEEERQSAVMQTLMIVQEAHGHLTEERMNAVAEYLRMPQIAVYEIATFYSMYEHKPRGKHKLLVCRNLSCKLRGADDVIEHLKETLNVEDGQTTADSMFTLKSTIECLGACVNAPMLQCGKQFHEKLTSEKLDEMIFDYRKQETK